MSFRSWWLVAVAVSACDLSDLTDGRGGAGALGGAGGAGAAGGAGGVGGVAGGSGPGGSGAGGCTPAESPFTWLNAIGNDASQATHLDDLVDAPLSSIGLAVDPTNGQLVVAMVTSGGALLPEDASPVELKLYVARFDSNGVHLWHRAHPQPISDVAGAELVIDDVYVDEGGWTIITGRRGDGDVNFLTKGGSEGFDISGGTDGFIAAFDIDGDLTDLAQLDSGNVDVGPHHLLSFEGDLSFAGSSARNLSSTSTFTCPALTDPLTLKRQAHVYSVAFQSGSGLETCTSARRFIADAGLGSALAITGAAEAQGTLLLTAAFEIHEGQELELDPMFSLVAAAGAEYTKDALVIALTPDPMLPTLNLEWVVHAKSTGPNLHRDTFSQLALVDDILWVAGATDTANVVVNLDVSRVFPDPGMNCSVEHPTVDPHANVIALDLDGNCLNSGLFGSESTADFLLPMPSAPAVAQELVVLGQARQSSFPDQPVSTEFTGTEVNGYVVKPATAIAEMVTVEGLMFGGPSAVRLDDAVVMDGTVVVAGSVGAARFLNLTCPAGATHDFYIGMIDPSYL